MAKTLCKLLCLFTELVVPIAPGKLMLLIKYWSFSGFL
jgi:hypothetical protein